MTHINIKISKAVATAEKDGIITTGMVGVPVSFMFDSWWDGLIVTAVFKGSGAPISVPLLGATDTVVPWEVLKRPSTLLRIGAEGRLPDGTLVIPTTWATVGIVMSGANATDDLAKPPTPTAFDRIMSQIGNMNDLSTEDKSSLVAAVNEAMEKGGGVDVSGASVGQIIKVAAVDDAGKPTAWEPADLPKQAQSDWDQNDESQADFVKNRPFYEKIDSVTLMPETQFSNLTHVYSPEISTPADVNGEFIDDFTISSDGTMIINTGDTVKVTFDGTVYDCVRQGKWIGNQSLTSYAGMEDTGEPFLFSLETIPSFHTKSTDCVVKVEADISQIKKIDSKFLELPIAPGSGENSTIENCTANYDNYTKNTANGKYSHAEGASNSADGDCSHAEGCQCSAIRDCSHAEGAGNKATGYYSHAEGGFGKASGYYAHSEGNFTKAIGDDSHSEGKGTIAKGKCQHVQGRYNVEDPTTVGTYAHIVGNGTDDDKRSNAHTLDWSGNAWFAGKVKVGGTGQYDNAAKTLATTEDIPTVDGTLTQSGQAADAKAVGDRLSTLSEEIVTTSESKVAAHNTGTDTHSDIRLLIQGLTDRLNALADSDDTTLDQLSEIVAYIKSNRDLIDAVTTSKVSVSDIVNDLVTNVADKPLSAAQGVVLKGLIDALRNDKLDAAELTNAVNTALAQAKASGEFDGEPGPAGKDGTGVISVKDCGVTGDGVTDDTAAIQAALDAAYSSGFSAVRFPAGTYKVTADKADNNFYAALNVHSGQHLIFESATLHLSANSYDFYAVVNVHNVENVTLTGNLTIIGDRESHTGTTGESGHGIRIVNSKNVRVRDVDIRYTWGDGVCVGGNGTMEEISENVTLERIRTYKCSRNGLSIIEANGVVVRDCDFTYTDRTAPQYGIDVEPNLGTATNIYIENVKMLNNGVGSFALYSTKATMDGVVTLSNIETDKKTIIYTSGTGGGLFDVSINGWRHTQQSDAASATIRLSGNGNLRIKNLHITNQSGQRVVYPFDAKNILIDGLVVEDDPSVSIKGTLSVEAAANVSMEKIAINGFLSRNPNELTYYSGNEIKVDNIQDTIVNLNDKLTTGGSSENYKLLMCDKALVLGTPLSAKARVFIPYTYGNVNPFRLVNTTDTKVQLYTSVSAGITFVGDVPGGSSANSAELTGNASYDVTPMLASGFVYVRNLNTRVPAKTSEITNDSGYQTAEQVESIVTGKGYRTASEQDVIDSGKVDKVTGKGLSSNDYTDAAKAKVDSLAPVATSGSYDDLTNKPTIPTAYDDTEVRQRIGAIEEKESTWDAKSNFSGSYNDLTDKPAIPDAVTEGTVSGWGFTKNTGTYSKPTGGIPKTDLANDVQASLGKAETALQEHQSLAAYRTSAAQDIIDNGKQDKITSTNKLAYSLISGTPTIPTVPTNVSVFTNDAGYLTLATLPKYEGVVE